MGHRQKKGFARKNAKMQGVCRLVQQPLPVPPHARVDGHIAIEDAPVVDEGVHHQQSAQGMSDQHPVRNGRV